MSQDAILSAMAQHSAYSYRASSTEVNKLVTAFNKESNAVLSRLRDLLDELSEGERIALSGGKYIWTRKTDVPAKPIVVVGGYSTALLQEISETFIEWQASLAVTLPESFTMSAIALAVHEANFAAALIGDELKPDGEKIFDKARSIPVVGGALIDEMLAKIATDVRVRVEYSIRQGIQDGLTNQQIVQAIKGKKEFNYQDGILNSTRSDIDRAVRTTRSHVSNVAYESAYEALGVTELEVCATLDGRTCKPCANYDGKRFAIDDPKRPRFPIHYHNRTVYIPVVENSGGRRPFVLSKDKVKDIPKDQREGVIGQANSTTKFKNLLARNDAFTKEWFGPKRYALYKEGKYTLDRFIDPLGKEYTLAELKALDAKTFKELGL